MERTVAEIRRIQAAFGKDAFALLSGVSSPTRRATWPASSPAWAWHEEPRLQRPLCMVSAGAGNKKAFGVDRAANSWADIEGAEVIWVSGANVAECAPITTDYIWRARDRGARLIV